MQWKVPLSDIDLGQDEIEAVVKVLESKWLTMGETTRYFETSFAEYLGVKYAFAVTNGTAALHIAHQVLGLTEGDEVICPSLTFVATANSILYTQASPVFAEVTGSDDLTISPDNIVEKITPRTKAITVVHYGGYPCDMKKIMQIAKQYGLYVVEDAAHAPGVELNGNALGTIGDIGCFSFFSNKNMTTGEGGMIVTNNPDLAEKIKRIRSHGMTTLTLDRHKGHSYSYDVLDLGYNYRLDEMRSAVGVVQLKKIRRNNQLRKKLVMHYRQGLKDLNQINLPFKDFPEISSYHIFPVLLNDHVDRKKFMDHLRSRGIQTSIHYPPIHLFNFYKEKFGYKEGMLPITEEICKREVTLPLYPNMGFESVEYVVESIKSLMNST